MLRKNLNIYKQKTPFKKSLKQAVPTYHQTNENHTFNFENTKFTEKVPSWQLCTARAFFVHLFLDFFVNALWARLNYFDFTQAIAQLVSRLRVGGFFVRQRQRFDARHTQVSFSFKLSLHHYLFTFICAWSERGKVVANCRGREKTFFFSSVLKSFIRFKLKWVLWCYLNS